MANNYFGNKIRQLRSSHSLSMSDLASKVGVTKGAVNMWENKGVVPRDDILVKLSKTFRISIDSLLGNHNYEGIKNENIKLEYIQRGLEKLDDKRLEKAENVLKAVFDDIWDDDEGDDEDDI